MALDQIDQERLRVDQIARFTKVLAFVAMVLVAIPYLIGFMSNPPGSLYLGIQTNLDDHMVYAAWMRQAEEGRFFFDNRFAVDPQPGLTVHLYFWVLGLLAKLVTIPGAMTLARLALTYAFVRVLGRFLTRLHVGVFAAKYMLLMACFGGGVGFLVWEKFGQDYVTGPAALKPLFGGRSPIDVWQPEAFVFPSMLTNGLFLAALCLILTVLTAVVDARDSWRPVLGGAVAFGLLMNIHSYDTLLVALVLFAFLVTQIVQKQATWAWVGRSLCIVAGALPAAAWFLYVLANDPVFQQRAATPTFSPTFQQVVFGILPPLVLAFVAAFRSTSRARLAGFAGLAVLVLALLGLSVNRDPSSFLVGPVVWTVLYAVAIVVASLLATKDTGWTLAWSWAVVGLVALYFPALFQRKLAMGLVVPWAVLAGFGLVELLKRLERSQRNLVATLTLFLFSGSSILWFQRETLFIRTNVGRTAVHSVYFSMDTARVLDALNALTGRTVVIAMPGVWNPVGPADFGTPQVTDLNPVLSGLAGVYTYAGHWSETPDYNRRRAATMAVFLATTPPEQRARILDSIRPDYIVAPNPEAFPTVVLGDQRVPIADLRGLGETVYKGNQLLLIKLAH